MVTTAHRMLDIEGFRKYLRVRVEQKSLSSGTVTTYLGALVQFNEWLGIREPIREICQEYVDKLTTEGKSNSTVATAAHAIKRYFRWKGISIDIEYPSIEMLVPEYLIVDQIEILLDECRTPLESVLVRLLFDTGARIMEISKMNISDIDWDKGVAKVIRKGGHEGNVIMQQDTIKAITEWIEVRKSISDKLFMTLGEQQLSNVLRQVGKRAGIPVRPHMLRHSRAIQFLEAGGDMWALQQLLGHLDIRTTMNIYGRFLPEHLRKHIPDPFMKAMKAKGG